MSGVVFGLCLAAGIGRFNGFSNSAEYFPAGTCIAMQVGKGIHSKQEGSTI